MTRQRPLRTRPTYQTDAAYLLKVADVVGQDERLEPKERAELVETLNAAVALMVRASQALNRRAFADTRPAGTE